MSVYKLYGSGVTDALASVDIVASGRITGVSWAAYGDLDADTETLGAEVSFSSTNGFTSNDTKSSFSTIRALAMDTGTAASNKAIAINTYVGPLSIPVSAGERVYLHGTGTSLTVTVYIYVDDKVSDATRRIRL